MRKLALLAALIAVATAPLFAEPPEFKETFDAYETGQDVLVAANGLYKSVANPSVKHGRVVAREGDAKDHVLLHKSDGAAIITRTVDGRVPDLIGDVTATIDIQPVSGKHSFYLWPSERRSKNRIYVSFYANGQIRVPCLENGKGSLFHVGGRKARFEPGRWYRLTIHARVDPTSDANTRFDISVHDLTADKLLGEGKDLEAHMALRAIGGSQVLSATKDRQGGIEARLDNWSLSGEVAKPAEKPAAKAQKKSPPPKPAKAEPEVKTAATPFAPDRPTATKGEIVFEPYLPAGATNLLVNGGVENDLKGWEKGEDKYTPERAANFVFKRDTDGARSGDGCLFLRAHTNEHTGYWSQVVPVEAGTTYLVNVWAKMKNSRILVWMTGRYDGNKRFNERVYLLAGTAGYLVPVILAPRYTTDLAGGGWELLSRTITIPGDMSKLRFSVGSYGGDGDIWFDDMSVIEAPDGGAPVRVCVRPEGRRLREVSLFMQSTGDQLRRDVFEQGADAYDKVFPGTDIVREGYGLTVTFDDGKSETRFLPCRDQQLKR